VPLVPPGPGSKNLKPGAPGSPPEAPGGPTKGSGASRVPLVPPGPGSKNQKTFTFCSPLLSRRVNTPGFFYLGGMDLGPGGCTFGTRPYAAWKCSNSFLVLSALAEFAFFLLHGAFARWGWLPCPWELCILDLDRMGCSPTCLQCDFLFVSGASGDLSGSRGRSPG